MGHGTSERPCATQKAGAIAPATAPRRPLTSRGPKPPASAHPAPGGRFSPAGPGAGLLLVPDPPVYRALFRAGGETRVAFPSPARRGEGTFTASLAGAIPLAKAPRCPMARREPRHPVLRPPRPRRALPFVALVQTLVMGPWSLTGRQRRGAFPGPPGTAAACPESGKPCHAAASQDALPAPCEAMHPCVTAGAGR